MKNSRTKRLVLIALYAALCMVMQLLSDFIPFLQMPNGGSIELGYAVLFVAAFHLGPLDAFITAVLWWLIGLMFGHNNWFLNVPQYALDYLIPLFVCALAPLYLPGSRRKAASNVAWAIPGIVIGMILKYVSTVLSGAIYWPVDEVSGSAAAWTYSLSYNLWYNLATCVVCMILTPLLISKLKPVAGERF